MRFENTRYTKATTTIATRSYTLSHARTRYRNKRVSPREIHTRLFARVSTQLDYRISPVRILVHIRRIAVPPSRRERRPGSLRENPAARDFIIARRQESQRMPRSSDQQRDEIPYDA